MTPPDTSVYAALAGVVAITSAAQLALTAGIWSLSSSNIAAAKAAPSFSPEERDLVDHCHVLGVVCLLLASLGLAVNAGSLLGWWYSLTDVGSIPALVVPFWSVVAVGLGAFALGLAAAIQLLTMTKPKTPSKTHDLI